MSLKCSKNFKNLPSSILLVQSFFRDGDTLQKLSKFWVIFGKSFAHFWLGTLALRLDHLSVYTTSANPNLSFFLKVPIQPIKAHFLHQFLTKKQLLFKNCKVKKKIKSTQTFIMTYFNPFIQCHIHTYTYHISPYVKCGSWMRTQKLKGNRVIYDICKG